MKPALIIGSLVASLAIGVAAAPPARTPFETARGQALALHQSLIGSVKPQARAKISAAARAAKACLTQNPRSCNLHAFLTQDLRTRFPQITPAQLDVLMTLAYAETMADLSQEDQLVLQESMQQQAQMIQTISSIMKSEHDTVKAIIQNLRS